MCSRRMVCPFTLTSLQKKWHIWVSYFHEFATDTYETLSAPLRVRVINHMIRGGSRKFRKMGLSPPPSPPLFRRCSTQHCGGIRDAKLSYVNVVVQKRFQNTRNKRGEAAPSAPPLNPPMMIAGEPQRGSCLFSIIARRRQNLSDVRLKTCAVDCVFISGHSGVFVNARRNIDRFRAIVPLSQTSRTR